jgi:hypothetical protein
MIGSIASRRLAAHGASAQPPAVRQFKLAICVNATCARRRAGQPSHSPVPALVLSRRAGTREGTAGTAFPVTGRLAPGHTGRGRPRACASRLGR